MGEDALGQFPTGRHEKRRPVNRMEAKDLFTDQVEVSGPAAFAFDGTDVGGESVKPNVEDVRGIGLHRNAPFNAGARDGEGGEASFHEG